MSIYWTRLGSNRFNGDRGEMCPHYHRSPKAAAACTEGLTYPSDVVGKYWRDGRSHMLQETLDVDVALGTAVAPPAIYLASVDMSGSYSIDACAATPADAVALLKRAYHSWWRDLPWADTSTWGEHLEGGDVTVRALVPGTIYVDGEPLPSTDGRVSSWAAFDMSGLPDPTYTDRPIR